ncbi:hypothetical protein Tco_0702894 [Tanacetum coccineum]|uniref:Uncharacterized protein n=1 Tax=Tanacetum coccineum TaxID=301880 RepID=A0ABQ4XZ61_9ASTR
MGMEATFARGITKERANARLVFTGCVLRIQVKFATALVRCCFDMVDSQMSVKNLGKGNECSAYIDVSRVNLICTSLLPLKHGKADKTAPPGRQSDNKRKAVIHQNNMVTQQQPFKVGRSRQKLQHGDLQEYGTTNVANTSEGQWGQPHGKMLFRVGVQAITRADLFQVKTKALSKWGIALRVGYAVGIAEKKGMHGKP